MKISIIMPTYNDCNLIASTIESVLNQTYTNWELLIIDDGSKDNTSDIVRSFSDTRIHFFQQENKGQLVALNNISQYVTGDLVLLLHSDDRLYQNNSLEKNIHHFNDPEVDGIYCSMVQFFDSGHPDFILEPPKTMGKKAPKKVLTLLGSNIIMDHFFVRREKFESHVKINYLKWYIEYWFDFKNDTVTSLNLKYTNTPWYQYRVYVANYTNSVIGNFEVYLARFRAIFFLSEYFTVPFPLLQKELYRRFKIPSFVLNQPANNLHLAKCIKANIRSMRLRTPNAFTWYFEKMYNFYTISSSRTVSLSSPIYESYLPSEARKFFYDMQNDSLAPLYRELIMELSVGFNSIVVSNLREKEILNDVLKFLCIRANIIINNKDKK
jgi:glycosyltransferase involved in cell wall biosynthesis